MKKEISRSIVPEGPWPYFWVFAAVNAFIAYTEASPVMKSIVGCLGLGLPWLVRYGRPEKRKFRPWEGEFFSVPGWALLVVMLGGVFLRLFRLVSLPAWPMWDDGANAYLAIAQNVHWSWSLWYGWELSPALPLWLQALFFRVVQPSLGSLWLFPALESILALFLSNWACRCFTSKSFAWLFSLLLATCFWPIYASKFCIPAGLCMLWEPLCLGLLGHFCTTPDGKVAWVKALVLGIALGVGLHIWFVTPPLIFLIGLAFSWICLGSGQKHWVPFFLGLGAGILLALPLVPGLLENFRSGHLHQNLIPISSGSGLWEKLQAPLSYLTALFWGPIGKPHFCFGPLWGGFLNPVLGSTFLLGLGEGWKRCDRKAFGWILGGLGLCLFPALFFNDLEMFRICLALPFVLLFCALGSLALVRIPKLPRTQGWGPVLLLALSLAFDLFHLGGPYHQWSIPGSWNDISKSPERYRAYPILARKSREKGPGLVLTQFTPSVFDQSLLVAAYPFNAALNPALDRRRASWMGVLVSEPQHRYLRRRFPAFRWYDLSTDIRRYDDRLWLGILVLKPGEGPDFQRWAELDSRLEDIYPLIPYDQGNPHYRAVLEATLPLYNSFKNDPFLEAVLREKIADFQFSGGDMERFLRTVKPLIASDLAFALLYRRIGAAYFTLGQTALAKEYFQKAALLNPRHSPPPGLLRQMDQGR